MIPGFELAKGAAERAGALCFCISGSGPTVFALCRERDMAGEVVAAVKATFVERGTAADGWVSAIASDGASGQVTDRDL